MKHSNRFSIAGLMGVVLIAALGLGALRSASASWAGATFLATCAVLGLAVVGVSCRGAGERPWWFGFALFGWGYMALAFLSPIDSPKLPTLTLLEAAFTRAGMPAPEKPDGPQVPGGAGGSGGPAVAGSLTSLDQTGHCLWAILAASLGGILSRALFTDSAPRDDKTSGDARPAENARLTSWHRPAAMGLTGFALVTWVAVAVAGLTLRRWADATFLLTCTFLVLAVLGALLGRGRRRQIWLGAALFGWGYLILVFGWQPHATTWPRIATGHFLENVRPWLPSYLSGLAITDDRPSPANARILQTLEQPVPMRFLEETPLEDVLKYVKNATKRTEDDGIRIFVDPIGLSEADVTMASPVVFHMEGVPLRVSLFRCLKQLGLIYRVKDGFLQITSEEQSLLPYEDPFMIVGHCLFALIAALSGAVLAPIVAGRRRIP